MKPSPYRAGIDIVDVRRIQHSIEKFGDRFLNRIFTQEEQSYCLKHVNSTKNFAARFAAKEAVIKVLRPEGIILDWRTIEIRRHAAGYCDVHLYREAAALAEQRGIVALSVSLSHEAEYATALVVADFLTDF
jgi:holo-[acyl-carrier protein] synthase